jgi:hypothetical protein
MSYYILPKINNNIIVNPIDCVTSIDRTYISHSLFNYHLDLKHQIADICIDDIDFNNNTYEELIKIVNPYEYVFSKVPGSKFSVSKLKPDTNLYYDFLEVCTTMNVLEPYKSQTIKSLHISHNNNDTMECFEMLREDFNDDIRCFDTINEDTVELIGVDKFEFLFVETNQENLRAYIISLLEIIMIILKNQTQGGSCIIKISGVFYKPVTDILYILSSLYDKTYILKPNTSNITTFDKYIICKNFNTNEEPNTKLRYNYFKLLVFLKKLDEKHIVSILDFDIPYYFTMKLNDMNIIIGQQQLESLNFVINILKNKNKDEKIETIKKNNIQKSVAWCEKYKIPCNKFSEKTNIFLPITKEIKLEFDDEIEVSF